MALMFWKMEVLTMPKEFCQDCEKLFEAKSGKAFICPVCHKKRLSKYAKERQLNKLGMLLIQKYVLNGGADDATD